MAAKFGTSWPRRGAPQRIPSQSRRVSSICATGPASPARSSQVIQRSDVRDDVVAFSSGVLQDVGRVARHDRLRIQHFFEVYPDVEPGKSVDGANCDGPTKVRASLKRYRVALEAPA